MQMLTGAPILGCGPVVTVGAKLPYQQVDSESQIRGTNRMKLIAWAHLGMPGGARLVDGAELARMQMVLNGEPFFDRDGLRSLIEKGLTLVHRNKVALTFAAVNSCLVEMAVQAGQGNLDGMRGLFDAQTNAEESLMGLVSYDGSPNAHAAVTMLQASLFNHTVIARHFDPEVHRSFLAGLSQELSDIKTDKVRLQQMLDSSSGDKYMDRRRLELQVESLGKVERDARLVKSAAEDFTPLPHQQVSRSTVASPRTASGSSGGGCYVATAVYGSYDCAQVRVLRDWRDRRLATNPTGKAFIRVYYALSPTLVRGLGRQSWFVVPTRMLLDRLISILNRHGYGTSPTGPGASTTRDWRIQSQRRD